MIRKNKDIYILFVFFLIHVAVLFALSSFPKSLETYGDELIYLETARSLFEGDAIEIHGALHDFTSLLYPILIAPLCAIKDTIYREKLLSLLNCILVSSTVFPTFFICKELEIKKTFRWLVILIVSIWPDMLVSMTFMSESLYFPLSAFSLYYCIKWFKEESCIWAAFAGLFSYLTFFCKEVGICVFLACFAVRIILEFYDFANCKFRFPKLNKNRTKQLWVYTISFAICYIMSKIFFLNGMQDSYVKSGAINFSLLTDPSNLLYLFYAVLYYLVAVTIAFFVLPAITPMLRFKQLNALQKQVYLLGILLLIGSILVIAVTISIKEDWGKMIPRVHLRYLFPLVVLFLPIYFSILTDYKTDLSGMKNDSFVIIAFGIIGVLIFKGVNPGCCTETLSLQYVKGIEALFPNIVKLQTGEINFYPLSCAIICFYVFISVIIYMLNEYGKNKMATISFSIIAIVICSMNCIYAYRFIKNGYVVDEANIKEMDLINDYFIDNELESSNVVYIGSGGFSKDAKIYDLYFDASTDEFEWTFEQLEKMIGEVNGENLISSMSYNEVIWGTEYTLDTVDYFIIGEGNADILGEIGNIKKIDEVSGSEFSLYKNVSSDVIDLN